MGLRRFSKREKIILYITISIIIVGSVAYFLMPSVFAMLEKIDREVEQKTFLLRRHFELTQQGEDTFCLYERYKDRLGQEGSSEEITAGLFEKIEKLAAQFNLHIERIRPQFVKEKKGYKQAVLEVELEGNFRSIFQFINSMETSFLFVQVSSFQLVPSSRFSGQVYCSLGVCEIFFDSED